MTRDQLRPHRYGHYFLQRARQDLELAFEHRPDLRASDEGVKALDNLATLIESVECTLGIRRPNEQQRRAQLGLSGISAHSSKI